MTEPFRLPTRTFVGPGSLARLVDIVAEAPAGRVLLVTDKGLRDAGAVERVLDLLNGRAADVVDDVAPNPRAREADRVAEQWRHRDVALVVALGGGSVMDAAKAIALMLRNPGSCLDYVGRNRFSRPAAPLVAIPTTCGTGSEVTWVSVLSDRARRTKVSVKGDGLFPHWALVDPDLLVTLPASLVAATGMDALTHAVEAFVGRAANPVSDALAAEAVRVLLTYLPRAFDDIRGDAVARDNVMRASTLAGMAFGNADVGGVHCLSEAIGGRHDLPHGLLNAALLVPVLQYQMAEATPRLALLDGLTGGMGSADGLLRRIADLGVGVRIPPFSTLGVPEDDFGAIADAAFANGSNASNPKPMDAGDYRHVLDTHAGVGNGTTLP